MDFQLHASRSGAFDFGKVTSNFTSNTYIEGGSSLFIIQRVLHNCINGSIRLGCSSCSLEYSVLLPLTELINYQVAYHTRWYIRRFQ